MWQALLEEMHRRDAKMSKFDSLLMAISLDRQTNMKTETAIKDVKCAYKAVYPSSSYLRSP